VITALLVGADLPTRVALGETLAGSVQLRGASAEVEGLADECRAAGSPLALVVIGAERATAFHAVAALARAGVAVVAVGPKDPDLILGSLREGARHFVVDSDEAELRRVVEALAGTAAPAGRLGQLTALFATRGGVGATTVGVNLAGALARQQDRVCLLDFDLLLGDVQPFLDLSGGYSLSDVMTNMTRLDREVLDASVTRHASGVHVIAQSGKLEEAERIRTGGVRALLDFLRGHYQQLVVDGLCGFDELSLQVLDACQQIVMVLTQDVPSVRSTRRCLELFRQLGYADRQIKLVVNRYQRGSEITAEVISEAVGLPVAHTLANDFASASAAINRGVVLHEAAPRSPLTRDLESLAALVAGRQDSGEPRRTRSFFGNLLTRKGSDGTPRAA
jgi:pilus assembly protein CpaE